MRENFELLQVLEVHQFIVVLRVLELIEGLEVINRKKGTSPKSASKLHNTA